MKLRDLKFANEVPTPAGEAVDTEAPKRDRQAAKAAADERFRKRRL